MALGIDWINQQILVGDPQVVVLVQDLIDFIREQEATDQGIAFGSIALATGKEDLGNGVLVGITVELNDPWQLKFWEGDYSATITGGNLVGGLKGDPIAYTAGVQVVLIQSAASTMVVTGGSGSVLGADLSDDQVVPSNSLGDLIRKLFWQTCNRQVINQETGDVTGYKTDGETPAVTKTITKGPVEIERSDPLWP